VEAVLFDGADRVNDVCCGDKLFTMEVEEESSSSAEWSSIGALDFNIVAPLNSLNNSDERAVFDAVAGIIRPIMAMGRAPNGLSCDVLFIFVAIP
jgi:hypothetical protein